MPQEFLASFAVDIDEGGVNRLQTILKENRDMANQLAAAFDAARSSMMDFIEAATAEAAQTFTVNLDFSRASKQLDAFFSEAKKKMKLSANASGIVSAASAALSQVRSMLANANLTLKVKVETEGEIPTGSKDSGKSNTASGTSVSTAATSGFFGTAIPVQLSTGGRFSSPTRAEIAEDGDPEYVVPVKKENEAVPLVRSLLSELSASARESLRDALETPHPSLRDTFPSEGNALAAIPDLFASAASAASPVIQQTSSSNVSAPVNIHVEAAAADPEAVGRSIYDTAERYLLRTLQTVS